MNQPVLTLYRYRCVSVPDVFVYRSLEGSPGGPAEVSCMALSGGEHFWTWHDMTVHPWNWPFQKERFSSNHQFLRGCGRTNCFKCTTILFPPAIMEAEHGALEDEFSLQGLPLKRDCWKKSRITPNPMSKKSMILDSDTSKWSFGHVRFLNTRYPQVAGFGLFLPFSMVKPASLGPWIKYPNSLPVDFFCRRIIAGSLSTCGPGTTNWSRSSLGQQQSVEVEVVGCLKPRNPTWGLEVMS